MAFLDSLTGGAQTQAAEQQRGLIASLYPALNAGTAGAYSQAGDALRTGFAGARDDLTGGYGAATGAINAGAGGAFDFLDAGTGGALDRLAAAKGTLTAGGGAFTPLSELAERYRGGAGLYADSLGINGAEGNTRAQGAFQAGPAYEWQRGQGIDALARKANASGQLVGGNADRDAIDYASNLAKTSYGSWQDRLAAYNPLELQATSGAATGNAGINRDVAGLDVTGAGFVDAGGRAKAGVSAAQGNSLAELANRYYGGQAGLDTAEGGAMAGNYIGGQTAQNNTIMGLIPQYNSTYKQQGDAATEASKNQVNLAIQGAKLAVGAAAGGFGGGDLGSFATGGGVNAGNVYDAGGNWMAGPPASGSGFRLGW